MDERFDVVERWPELFEQLNDKDRHATVQALAAIWHEGWAPNREDVENLTDVMRGAIDEDEYMRRAAEAAERHRRAKVAAS